MTTPAPPEGFTVTIEQKKPEVEAPEGFTKSVPLRASPFESTDVQREAMSTTAVGRIMDALGEGAAHGWGTTLGLNEEQQKNLDNFTTIQLEDDEHPLTINFRAFNQKVLLPLAVGLDATLRAGGTPFLAATFGLRQTMLELGFSTGEANSAARDFIGVMDSLMILGGSGRPIPFRRVRVDEPVKPAGPHIEPVPPKPAAPVKAKDEPSLKPGVEEDIPEAKPDPTVELAETPERIDEPTLKPAEEVIPGQPSRLKSADELAKEKKADDLDQDYSDAPFDQVPDRPEVQSALEAIASGTDIKKVIRDLASSQEAFSDARRGTITLVELERLANSLGMTVKRMQDRKIGQAHTAEELRAYSNVIEQNTANLKKIAKKIVDGQNDDATLVELDVIMNQHVDLAASSAGSGAEAGRALRALQVRAEQRKQAQDLGVLIQSLGGRKRLEAAAQILDYLETPYQVSKMTLRMGKPGFWDRAAAVWINLLLSNPVTQVVNLSTNAFNIANSIAFETPLAAGIGTIRRGLGIGQQERVMFLQQGAEAFAALQTLPEAAIIGAKTLKTQVPTRLSGKVELNRPHPFTGPLGRIITTPGDLMMVGDDVFKALNYRFKVKSLAYEQAIGKEGLRGQKAKQRIAELVEDIPDDIDAAAWKFAEDQTFTRQLGPLGLAFQNLVGVHPSLRFLFPFIRTPINIFKFAGKRTPLGLISKEIRQQIKAGGPEGDRALARMMMGTGLGISIYNLAADGIITGSGSTDPAQRATDYAAGWQPYSVKIGNNYYSYGRLEPFGIIMGIAADMALIIEHATDEEVDEVASAIMMSLSKNVSDKTFLSGATNLAAALADPTRYGESYTQKFVSSFVPAGVAQIARINDPILRDAQTTIDAIKARIPGLSASVKPSRDIYGEPIQRGGAVGPDILSPIYQSRIRNDTTTSELVRLGIGISQPDPVIDGVELTVEQQDDYERVAGRLARFHLKNLIEHEFWTQLKSQPELQKDLIRDGVDRSRDQARNLMRMKYPNIVTDAVQQKLDKYDPTITIHPGRVPGSPF